MPPYLISTKAHKFCPPPIWPWSIWAWVGTYEVPWLPLGPVPGLERPVQLPSLGWSCNLLARVEGLDAPEG